MGSPRAAEIEDTLEDIEELNKRTGKSFRDLKRRIQNLGTKDYDMKRALTFRKNVMEELEKIKDQNPEFKKIYEHFSKITNPLQFYEEIKKSQALYDFFAWYKNPSDYADFTDFADIAQFVENEYGFYVPDDEQQITNIIHELEIVDYRENKKKKNIE